MSAEDGNGNGDSTRDDGGNRATVALVRSELQGFRDLTVERLDRINEKFDRFAGLPEAVARLQGAHDELRSDVDELKRNRERSSDWRRNILPVVALMLLATVVSVVLVLTGAYH